jgi:hypothetical protein
MQECRHLPRPVLVIVVFSQHGPHLTKVQTTRRYGLQRCIGWLPNVGTAHFDDAGCNQRMVIRRCHRMNWFIKCQASPRIIPAKVFYEVCRHHCELIATSSDSTKRLPDLENPRSLPFSLTVTHLNQRR